MGNMKIKTSGSAFFTNPVIVFVGALIVTALWGSGAPFIKLGYQYCISSGDIPSTLLFAGIRSLFAGIITILCYSVMQKRIVYPKRESLLEIMGVGSFQTVIHYILYYVGLANTTVVKGAIASGASPFFDLLFATLVFKQEKFTLKKLIAILIGFSGIVVANVSGLTFNMNFLGDGFVILSGVFFSISLMLVKKISQTEDPVVITGYQFIFGGAILIIGGLSFGGSIRFDTLASISIIAYLSVSIAIAYILWSLLLKYNPVTRVSVFFFMMPVFGVIFSQIILPGDGEFNLPSVVTSLLLFCIAVVMINYTPKKDRLK